MKEIKSMSFRFPEGSLNKKFSRRVWSMVISNPGSVVRIPMERMAFSVQTSASRVRLPP